MCSGEDIFLQRVLLWKTHTLSEGGEALFESEHLAGQLLPITCPFGDVHIPHWFAVYTTARHEKRVEEHLRWCEVESFLPLYRTTRRWQNRCKVQLDLPLFPNYIFVRIPAVERIKILGVPGVLSIVGAGSKPIPLPEMEIEVLRAARNVRRIEPHPYLVVGNRARIRSGPMAGVEGVLIRKKSGFRVVLSLDLIMRSVAVEVDADELEPLATPNA